jgi:hypothetical protein
MNDAGQFVFAASLNDGRSGIYRADPVPEPMALGAVGLLAFTLGRGRGRLAPKKGGAEGIAGGLGGPRDSPPSRRESARRRGAFRPI